jgi:uncharacterized protein (DUF1015 family)
VPIFSPFRALRYAPSLDLGEVTAPPYDVLSPGARETLATCHTNNIVHIDLPTGEEPYAHAADLLHKWRQAGVLVLDAAPSFTLYRMQFVDASGERRSTVGILGALEVVDEGAAGVLPHEQTTPKAKTDRLDLTRATRTNLSPVWGLSLHERLTDALLARGEPLGSFTDSSGVYHAVERVDDPTRVRSLASLVGASPILIADGHHRYAIARTYRDEMAGTPLAAAARTTLAYVGELVEEQLSIAAIHRLYRGVSAEVLRGHFEKMFVVQPCNSPVDEGVVAAMSQRGSLCLLDTQQPDGELRGWWLTPRDEAFAGLRDLDSDRLEVALRDLTHEVAYQHGFNEVAGSLRSGVADAAVLIRPTSIDEIRRTADERILMPPKSTFFTPKLRTGLVLRPLEP